VRDCWAALVIFIGDDDAAEVCRLVCRIAVSGSSWPWSVSSSFVIMPRCSVVRFFSAPLADHRRHDLLHAPVASVIKVSATNVEHMGLGGEPRARLS